MPSFKKLALIATEIQGKTSAETAEMAGTAETAETADMATDSKTIPPTVFQNEREVKSSQPVLLGTGSRALPPDLYIKKIIYSCRTYIYPKDNNVPSRLSP